MSKLKFNTRIAFNELYLLVLLVLVSIDSPLNLLGTFFDNRDITTYIILYSIIFIDFLFIYLNKKSISFSKIELFLIFLLLLSFIIGLKNGYFSVRRLVGDFVNPLFFILKISIIRNLFCAENAQDIVSEFLRKYIKWTFVAGLFTIIMFYILNHYRSMYAGLTPILHPYFLWSILENNYFGILVSIVLILLTGKRGMMISAIFILITKLLLSSKITVKGFLFFIVSLSFFVLFISQIDFSSISALDKIAFTFEQAKEIELTSKPDDSQLAVIEIFTANRSAEIVSVLAKMNGPFDFIFGRGIGFTYPYESMVQDFSNPEYANVHFTPINLITKYGLIFYLVLAFYIAAILFKGNAKSKTSLFLIIMCISIIVDSFFAYVIFVIPFFPIALGFIQANYKFNSKKICVE